MRISFKNLAAAFIFFVGAFLSSTSFAQRMCFVDVDLACVRPADADKIVLSPLTWTIKSQAARAALLSSADVQQSPVGCLAFAHLMKTECAIEFPVTAVFSSGPGEPMITSLATGFYPLKACEPDLSAAFSYYFSRAGIIGSPPKAKCIADQFTYLATELVSTIRKPLKVLSPVNVEGEIVSCLISPNLPLGVMFDSKTCVISGTPKAKLDKTTYKISALTSKGSFSTDLSLTIIGDSGPLTGIAYSGSSYQFYINQAIVKQTPVISGGKIETCSVSPALPAGLNLSILSCTISGTPKYETPPTVYTVKAANYAGSVQTTLTLSTTLVPPTVTFAPNHLQFTLGVGINPLLPTLSGGGINKCIATPTLPAGLYLSYTNCSISGRPSVLVATQKHTITASNSGGSGSADIFITVNDLPPAIQYAQTTISLTRSLNVGSISPTQSGGPIVTCLISNPLPSGLTFNSSTCSITGVPNVLSSANVYVITARNSGGESKVNLTLSVVDPVPVIKYPAPNLTWVLNKANPYKIIPNSTGGPIASCSISPTLPLGLNLNSYTCEISGTPVVLSGRQNYTVHASNTGGSSSDVVTIEIKMPSPVIVFSPQIFNWTIGQSVNAQPANSGGGIFNCTSQPALPSGIGLNTSNCAISGAASGAPSGPANYLITASNSGGVSTQILTITVSAAPSLDCTFVPLDPGMAPIHVANGTSIRAYQAEWHPTKCVYQDRLCTNGSLSGSYQYRRCSAGAPE